MQRVCDIVKSVDLRFPSKSDERNFRASLDLRFCPLIPIISGSVMLVHMMSFILKYDHTSYPIQVSEFNAKSYCLGVWLYLALSGFASASVMLLHTYGKFFSAMDLENFCLLYASQFGVLLSCSNAWHGPVLLDEDPITVWGIDVRASSEMNMLLAQIALTSLVCVFVPIRNYKIWVVPTVLIAPYVLLLLAVGSAFPKSLGTTVGIVLATVIVLFCGAWRNEVSLRQDWLLLQKAHASELRLQSELTGTEALAAGMKSVAETLCNLVVPLTHDLFVIGCDTARDNFLGTQMENKAITSLMSKEGAERFTEFVASTSVSKMPQCLPMTLSSGSLVIEADLLVVDMGSKNPKYLLGIRADRETMQPEPDSPSPKTFAAGQAAESSLVYSESVSTGLNTFAKPRTHDFDTVSFLSDRTSNPANIRIANALGACPGSANIRIAPRQVFVDREVQTLVQIYSPASLPQRPPLSPHMLRAPHPDLSDCGTSDDDRSSTGSTRSSTEGAKATSILMVNHLSPTSLRHCCVSMESHMMHWNLVYNKNVCCPLHAALKVTAAAVRKLNRRKCNPLWAPFAGWSCTGCTCTNPQALEACAICGTPSPDLGLGTAIDVPCLENFEFSFDALEGKIIHGSASFVKFFGPLHPDADFYALFSSGSGNINFLQEIQLQTRELECKTDAATIKLEGRVVVLAHPSLGLCKAVCTIALARTEVASSGSGDGAQASATSAIVAHGALTSIPGGNSESAGPSQNSGRKHCVSL